MSKALLELQKAIYTALNGDSALSAVVEGVFNHVPQGTGYPYVVISGAEAEDISSLASHKERLTLLINIYSEQQGAKQALEIAGEIHRILHQQSLSLASGYTLEILQVKETDARRLASGKLWVVQARLEARVRVD